MSTPAIVMGDTILGPCPNHLIPGPLGVPTPAGAMPFSGKILLNTVPTVLIAGKPAAVLGSQALNAPPHVGLHPADPFMVPLMQKGTIMGASPTVLIGGKPAAKPTPPPMLCAVPGQVIGSAATVLIG